MITETKVRNWCLRCSLSFQSYNDDDDICHDCIAEDINAVFGIDWLRFTREQKDILAQHFKWAAENLGYEWWLREKHCQLLNINR